MAFFMEVLQTIKYSGIRKRIGEKMIISCAMPHTFQILAVDITALDALRRKINAERDMKLTVTDFIVKACSIALQEVAIVNSALTDNIITVYKSCNIGVITAVEEGLVGPVIKEAQTKSLFEISDEAKTLFNKARDGTLMPEDYSDSTFTITNIGMLNIDSSIPLIFPPQAAILGVCTAKKRPVVIEEDGEDKIAVRLMMNLTLAGDHRIIDGVPIAKFLNSVRGMLENPEKLLTGDV